MGHANKYGAAELLRKFYEGTSSLAEEEALRRGGADGCAETGATADANTAGARVADMAVRAEAREAAGYPEAAGTAETACVPEAAGTTEAIGTRAAAAMFELFRQEREVCCPGNATVPLRRHRKLTVLLRSAVAAAAVVLIALTVATLSKPDPEIVYCFVNGQPVTDYETAVEQSEIAIGILSESLEMTAGMLKPLDDVDRMVRELEEADIFGTLFLDGTIKNNNS